MLVFIYLDVYIYIYLFLKASFIIFIPLGFMGPVPRFLEPGLGFLETGPGLQQPDQHPGSGNQNSG